MDWHLRCKVQNYLTLIQRDYVTHQSATLVWYSLHRMSLLWSECGIIGPESPDEPAAYRHKNTARKVH